jgi:hypothetical protein
MTLAYEFVERSRGFVRLLERRHDAPAVARKVKVGLGTLQNLRRGRLKSIPVDVYERLRAAVTRELEHEIKRLEAELVVARQGAVDPRSDEVGEVEAHLQAAREALAGGAR